MKNTNKIKNLAIIFGLAFKNSSLTGLGACCIVNEVNKVEAGASHLDQHLS